MCVWTPYFTQLSDALLYEGLVMKRPHVFDLLRSSEDAVTSHSSSTGPEHNNTKYGSTTIYTQKYDDIAIPLEESGWFRVLFLGHV